MGKNKQPTYRLIISEKTKDPWGDSLEILGNYNPRTNPKTVNLDTERIKYWLGKGAQASATIHNLFVDQGIVSAAKRKVSTIKRTKAAAAAAAAAKTAVPVTVTAPEEQK
jgi:small subunit ribosomal protein S16